MSGSGGAPQLDPDGVEAAQGAFARVWNDVLAPRDTTFDPVDAGWEALEPAIRAYLAASSGAGELDLSPGAIDAALTATTRLMAVEEHVGRTLGGVGGLSSWRKVRYRELQEAEAWLRARLDRKDDEA